MSVETVVPCNGELASLNTAVRLSSLCCARIWQVEGGRLGSLICKRIDMDEPAQCCCCSLCCGSKYCLMLQLDAARAMDCHTYALRGARKYRGWTDINQISLPNVTEEFLVCSSGTKIQIGLMSSIPDMKILCRDWFCVATIGGCRPKVPTFGCRADMLPTCWQLSQPSSFLVTNHEWVRYHNGLLKPRG